ncbi:MULTISPECIES: hypothetical protein [Erwinia]|uniref:hypothetical protein n=1 Tax=Erwinia TaxID=551 RepID=UPI00068F74F9|nr:MULTISPECIES: hypothetical protein [Erwinia]
MLKKLTSSLLFTALCWTAAQAEPVTLRLAQEQDGGEAGRACIYIHQGKAEYRLVPPAENCPGAITIERASSRG